MTRIRLILPIGAVLAAAIGLTATGWCMVAPGEVVVVRRLGRVVEPPWGPGLHWHFPAGIDRLDRIRTDAVRQLTIGQSGTPAADQEPSAGEVLTGDLNLLRIEATLQYRVADAVDHALCGEQADELLAMAVEASLSRSLARRGVDAVLRSDRRRVAQEVQDDLQRSVDGLRLGILILGVSLTDVRPPGEVAADFAAAQSAEGRRDDRINGARTYEAVQLTTTTARGEAMRESARAEAGRTLLSARAEVDQFLALLAEVRRSRDLSLRRFYIDSVQSLLGRVRRKLILPPGDSIDLTVLGSRDAGAAPAVPQADRRDVPDGQERKDDH
jgi:membrane protease subunit HflK